MGRARTIQVMVVSGSCPECGGAFISKDGSFLINMSEESVIRCPKCNLCFQVASEVAIKRVKKEVEDLLVKHGIL